MRNLSVEKWRSGEMEFIQMFHSESKRGNHSVLMFHRHICGSGVRSKTIGMGDNESDDKEVMVGVSE